MEEKYLVETVEDIKENINTLEKYLNPFGYKDKRQFALDLIKRGTCFIAYKTGSDIKFIPSRFVGYANNDMRKHEENYWKDGRETNDVIDEILGTSCQEDPELEAAYRKYCKTLFITPNVKGSFGCARKYWRMF